MANFWRNVVGILLGIALGTMAGRWYHARDLAKEARANPLALEHKSPAQDRFSGIGGLLPRSQPAASTPSAVYREEREPPKCVGVYGKGGVLVKVFSDGSRQILLGQPLGLGFYRTSKGELFAPFMAGSNVAKGVSTAAAVESAPEARKPAAVSEARSAGATAAGPEESDSSEWLPPDKYGVSRLKNPATFAKQSDVNSSQGSP